MNPFFIRLRAALVCLLMAGASVAMYFGAETASLPVVGTNPAFTRIFAILCGLFMAGMAVYAWFIPLKPEFAGGAANGTKEPSDTTIEPVETRYAHLLPLHGIKPGHVPTVSEVQKFVDDLNLPLSPMGAFAEQGVTVAFQEGQGPDTFWGPWTEVGDDREYATLWVQRAPEAAFDSLIALLDAGRPLANPHDEEMDDSLPMVLGLWADRGLHPWLEKLGARLNSPRTRPVTVSALAWHPHEETIPCVEPWIARVNELSEAETLNLIALFGDVDSPRSLDLLRQLKATIQNPTEEVESELNGYIRQHEEKG